MTLTTEIAQKLVDDSVGGLAGTSSTMAYIITYRGATTTESNDTIGITPTGGTQQTPFSTGTLDRPSFQVMVKTKRLSTTHDATIDAIISSLDQYSGSTFGGVQYLDIQKAGDVLFLGRDEEQTQISAVNFRAVRARG